MGGTWTNAVLDIGERMPSTQDNEINHLTEAIQQMRRITFDDEDPNNRSTPQFHSTKWYYPDTIRVYDDLNKMHIRVITLLGQNNAQTIANCLISKIYYSVLIHIAIIRIRMITDEATETEIETYNAIDNKIKCSQLPLSKTVGQRFTQSLLYCNDIQQQFKIVPMRSQFLDARVDDDDDDCSYLVGLTISPNNMLLSDPIIPIRVMRWLRSRARNTNHSQTSNQSKLFYLTTGMIYHSSQIADQLFNTDVNPMETLLADPTLIPNDDHNINTLIQSLNSLPNERIPKDTILVRPNQEESDIGLLRLKNIATSNWFDHAKAVASTEAILCDELTILKKVIKPIDSSSRMQFDLRLQPNEGCTIELHSWNRAAIWT